MTQLLLEDDLVHSDTEITDTPTNKFRRVKLRWRTTELDELISLADQAVIAKEVNPKKRRIAIEFRASRAEYSPEEVPAEEQLPPTKYPRCLIKESFLTDNLPEATVDRLLLSDKVVNIQSVLELLRKKLGKGNTMQVSPS